MHAPTIGYCSVAAIGEVAGRVVGIDTAQLQANLHSLNNTPPTCSNRGCCHTLALCAVGWVRDPVPNLEILNGDFTVLVGVVAGQGLRAAANDRAIAPLGCPRTSVRRC
jgi:hypothetical protein